MCIGIISKSIGWSIEIPKVLMRKKFMYANENAKKNRAVMSYSRPYFPLALALRAVCDRHNFLEVECDPATITE